MTRIRLSRGTVPALRRASIVVVWACCAVAQAGHDEQEPVNLVEPDQIKRLLDIGEKITFIDLRDAAQYARGHVPQARSIPITEFGKRFREIPQTGRVVMYCPCPQGLRDETYAYLLLRKERYRNVSVLNGGFDEWVKRGYAVQAGAS